MDFYGTQVLALADRSAAAGIFTPTRTEPVLRAAYELRNAEVASVDLVHARQVSVLPMSPDTFDGELTVWAPGQGAAWEGRVSIRTHDAAPAFDAELRLLVTTSSRTASTTVTNVRTTDATAVFNLAEVDTRIIAEDGSLPTGGTALEERRRTALLSLLLDRFEQPDDWNPDDFWREQGDVSVAEIVQRFSPPRTTVATAIDLVVEPDETPRTLDFVFDLSVLVTEDPVADLRSTLSRIRAARGARAASVTQPQPVPGAVLRTPVPVAVVCSLDAFDDADLPVPDGATPTNDAERREARLTTLNDRLADAGIAFVPV
jgi:hypothetical protein